MSKATYDIAKLEALGEIDVGYAVDHHDSHQTLFNGLDQFVEFPKKYFQDYNPTVVIYDDDTRQAFLAEVVGLKVRYASLGLKTLVLALTDLEHAVAEKSVGSLSDWIVSLNAKAEHMASALLTARIASADDGAPANTAPANTAPANTAPANTAPANAAPANAAPANTAPANTAPANTASANVKRDSKPVILAVDDKPELLTVLVNMLRDEYQVMAATSGAAALKVIERHNPQLFLLDIEMPVMDGYELAKIIRGHQQFADAPIIFLTGKNTREAVISAIANGGNDYIVKPVDRNVLIEKIKRCLE